MAAQFAAVDYRDTDCCVYVAELANGLVKIGSALNGRVRLERLSFQVRRAYRTRITRYHFAADLPVSQLLLIEREAQLRLKRIGCAARNRREFFHDVPFGLAVNLVNQLARAI